MAESSWRAIPSGQQRSKHIVSSSSSSRPIPTSFSPTRACISSGSTKLDDGIHTPSRSSDPVRTGAGRKREARRPAALLPSHRPCRGCRAGSASRSASAAPTRPQSRALRGGSGRPARCRPGARSGRARAARRRVRRHASSPRTRARVATGGCPRSGRCAWSLVNAGRGVQGPRRDSSDLRSPERSRADRDCSSTRSGWASCRGCVKTPSATSSSPR
jgi:hypothetical protein